MGIPLLPLRSSTIGAAAHSRSERQREERPAGLGTTPRKKTRRPPPRPRRERPRGAIWRGSEASRQSRPSRPSDRPPNTNARAEARCLPQGACDRRQRAAAVECRTAWVLAFTNHRQAYGALPREELGGTTSTSLLRAFLLAGFPTSAGNGN